MEHLAGEALVCCHAVDAKQENEVGFAGDVPRALNLLTGPDLSLESVQRRGALPLERHEGMNGQGCSEYRRIDDRHVGNDDAFLAEAPHAAEHGTFGKADLCGESSGRRLVVHPQPVEDGMVEGVEIDAFHHQNPDK